MTAILRNRNKSKCEENKNTVNQCDKSIVRELRGEVFRFFTIVKADRVLLCIFSLLALSVCWTIFLGYLFPSYTWDALWYHLPIVGYIMQSGAIQENATPSMIDLFMNIFPKNIELFFIWNTIFIRNDVLIDLSQLPFTLVGILTIISMSRKLGLSQEHALYSAFLFFFTPIIILQSGTNYIDIAVSVLFLISINFLMCSQKHTLSPAEYRGKQGQNTAVLLAGLTTGILVGSKGSGPLFAVMIFGFILMNEFMKRLNVLSTPCGIVKGARDRNQNDNLIKSTLIPYLLCFFIPAFLVGGYWYVKNWILYNNPVYPMEISLFNITFFKGLYGEIIEPIPEAIKGLSAYAKIFYVWRERLPYYIYDSRLGGLGPVWFILLVPSLVFSLFFSVKEKRYNFLLIIFIIIITFSIYPRNWTSRYVIFLVGLGSLAFGHTLLYFEKQQRALKIIVLLLVIYTFFVANSPCIVPLKIRDFLRLPAHERTIARHAPMNIDTHARKEYGLWIWLSRNLSSGDVLAYTFEPLFLSPLWNRDFSNKIVFMKSVKFNEWMKGLKKNNVTYVLVQKDSQEDKWVNTVNEFYSRGALMFNRGNRFQVLYADENYKVLRVQNGKAA
jgi:hypothetical protein